MDIQRQVRRVLDIMLHAHGVIVQSLSSPKSSAMLPVEGGQALNDLSTMGCWF